MGLQDRDYYQERQQHSGEEFTQGAHQRSAHGHPKAQPGKSGPPQVDELLKAPAFAWSAGIGIGVVIGALGIMLLDITNPEMMDPLWTWVIQLIH